MHKPAFHEDMVKNHDPVDGPSCDFDWDALDAVFGSVQGELHEKDWESMGIALRRILIWIVDVQVRNPQQTLDMIARRVLALAWVIDPGILQDSPTLTSLAKRIGKSKAVLSQSTTAASLEFGISNRPQTPIWNRKTGASTEENRHPRPSRAAKTAGMRHSTQDSALENGKLDGG